MNELIKSRKQKIHYIYATGNRVMKMVHDDYTLNLPPENQEYYIRDASGNIMTTYKRTNKMVGAQCDMELHTYDQPIYGSDRLGTHISGYLKGSGSTTTILNDNYGYYTHLPAIALPGVNTVKSYRIVGYRMMDYKRYEIKDHLGNVRTTFGDYRLSTVTGTGTGPYTKTLFEADQKSMYNLYAFGMPRYGDEQYYEANDQPLSINSSFTYRFGQGGHEVDDEIKGAGNSVDMGARMLDTRLGRTGSLDPKMGVYPGISPYAYALNTPINAIDPDGKLVIFVNGYRPCMPGVNIYREVQRCDQVFRGDKLGYWSGVDDKFLDRMGDHNAVYADGDAPTLTAANNIGFNARVAHGRKAGKDLISKLNSGEVTLQKNDQGEVIESIKVVAHSMGYAYSIGMIKELEKAGYKVEVSYNLAPENPKGGNIPPNVLRSVQYGSGPDDPWYQQDRIAPQSDIQNVNENAYIPDKNSNGENIPKGPIDSHLGANFGKWIFDLKPNEKGYVAPKQDTQVPEYK